MKVLSSGREWRYFLIDVADQVYKKYGYTAADAGLGMLDMLLALEVFPQMLLSKIGKSPPRYNVVHAPRPRLPLPR